MAEARFMLMVLDVVVPWLVGFCTGVTEVTPLHSAQVTYACVKVPPIVTVMGLLVALETISAYMKALIDTVEEPSVAVPT
jgi:hypothetical protein